MSVSLMNDGCKLSICIITYNHEAFIESTINSVLAQNIKIRYEIIIADDCSTDKTRSLLMAFSNKYENIKLILQEKNVGPSKNFKDLITAATGEYVAYLDGDDLMLPGKINFQIDFLDNNPDCNIVAHNMEVYDFSIDKKLGVFSKFETGKYTIDTLAGIGTFFCNSSKMYRNAANTNYPYYDSLKYVGDLAWHIYQTKESYIGYTSKCFGIYRRHEHNSSVKNAKNERLLLSYEDNKFSIEYALSFGASEKNVTKGIMRITYNLALQYLRLNNYPKYREYMRKSTEVHRFYSIKHFFLRNTLFLPNFILNLIS